MLRVLNDLHIGAVRSAGTTVASQAALTASLHTQFKNLLPDSGDRYYSTDLFKD